MRGAFSRLAQPVRESARMDPIRVSRMKTAKPRRERRSPVAEDSSRPLEPELVVEEELPVVEAEPIEGVVPGLEPVAGGPEIPAEEESRERGDGGGLVPFDPLSRYLAELRRFPVLSREEEAKVVANYIKTGDPQYAFQLVTANLRLVVKIAHEFARASRNLLDLIQEGNLGLMEAVKKFNPAMGVRFPSYAVWWIRAYIYRYLINNWRLVKIGTTQAQRKLFFNLRKESERLEAEGFAPQPRLLAQRIGVKETEVREMQERMAHSEVSLDQPLGTEDDDATLSDLLPDRDGNPEQITADSEFRALAHAKVEKFERTLRDKELEIFRARLLAENPLTLQEIGDRFGISRERVRQIEGRLKRRLKDFIKSEAPDIERAGT
jgi:RNA polymerase sigma-32 factor